MIPFVLFVASTKIKHTEKYIHTQATGSMIINPQQQLTLTSSTHNNINNKTKTKKINKNSYDVTDHVMDELMPVRNQTPCIELDAIGDNEFIEEQQQQVVQQQSIELNYEINNFEFSDSDEPRMTRSRTRSQSRAKEYSVPPTEEPKVTGLKRGKKAAKTDRRRKPLKEEPISDDDILLD